MHAETYPRKASPIQEADGLVEEWCGGRGRSALLSELDFKVCRVFPRPHLGNIACVVSFLCLLNVLVTADLQVHFCDPHTCDPRVK